MKRIILSFLTAYLLLSVCQAQTPRAILTAPKMTVKTQKVVIVDITYIGYLVKDISQLPDFTVTIKRLNNTKSTYYIPYTTAALLKIGDYIIEERTYNSQTRKTYVGLKTNLNQK